MCMKTGGETMSGIQLLRLNSGRGAAGAGSKSGTAQCGTGSQWRGLAVMGLRVLLLVYLLLLADAQKWPLTGDCSPCSCSLKMTSFGRQRTVNCSQRNLNSIPENLPADLMALDLSFNTIRLESLQNICRYTYLQQLSLSFTKLTSLSSILRKCSSMLELNLTGNQLVQVDQNTFQGLHNLRRLLGLEVMAILSNNVFRELKNLKGLDLVFLGESLPAGLFDNTEITSLNLVVKHAVSLPKGIFQFGQRTLNTLQLVGQNLTELDEDLLDGLNVLRKLYIVMPSVTKLPKRFFHSQQQNSEAAGTPANLRDVEISGVHTIPPGLFNQLVNLESLQLKNIGQFPQSEFLVKVVNLQMLVIKGSVVKAIPAAWFQELYSLKTLKLSGVKLETLDQDAFKGLINLNHLDLSDNNLMEITAKVFQPLAKTLETLILSGNALTEISQQCLSSLSALRLLDISENRLMTVHPESFARMTYLSSLYLNNNRLTSLPDNLFQDQLRVEELSLADNNLIDFPKAILRLKNSLLTLDLSSNQIRELPAADLCGFSYLETIDVLDNRLHCNCPVLAFSQCPLINVQGQCASPNQYKNKYLNQVHLPEVCKTKKGQNGEVLEDDSANKSKKKESQGVPVNVSRKLKTKANPDKSDSEKATTVNDKSTDRSEADASLAMDQDKLEPETDVSPSKTSLKNKLQSANKEEVNGGRKGNIKDTIIRELFQENIGLDLPHKPTKTNPLGNEQKPSKSENLPSSGLGVKAPDEAFVNVSPETQVFSPNDSTILLTKEGISAGKVIDSPGIDSSNRKEINPSNLGEAPKQSVGSFGSDKKTGKDKASTQTKLLKGESKQGINETVNKSSKALKNDKATLQTDETILQNDERILPDKIPKRNHKQGIDGNVEKSSKEVETILDTALKGDREPRLHKQKVVGKNSKNETNWKSKASKEDGKQDSGNTGKKQKVLQKDETILKTDGKDNVSKGEQKQEDDGTVKSNESKATPQSKEKENEKPGVDKNEMASKTSENETNLQSKASKGESEQGVGESGIEQEVMQKDEAILKTADAKRRENISKEEQTQGKGESSKSNKSETTPQMKNQKPGVDKNDMVSKISENKTNLQTKVSKGESKQGIGKSGKEQEVMQKDEPILKTDEPNVKDKIPKGEEEEKNDEKVDSNKSAASSQKKENQKQGVGKNEVGVESGKDNPTAHSGVKGNQKPDEDEKEAVVKSVKNNKTSQTSIKGHQKSREDRNEAGVQLGEDNRTSQSQGNRKSNENEVLVEPGKDHKTSQTNVKGNPKPVEDKKEMTVEPGKDTKTSQTKVKANQKLDEDKKEMVVNPGKDNKTSKNSVKGNEEPDKDENNVTDKPGKDNKSSQTQVKGNEKPEYKNEVEVKSGKDGTSLQGKLLNGNRIPGVDRNGSDGKGVRKDETGIPSSVPLKDTLNSTGSRSVQVTVEGVEEGQSGKGSDNMAFNFTISALVALLLFALCLVVIFTIRYMHRKGTYVLTPQGDATELHALSETNFEETNVGFTK